MPFVDTSEPRYAEIARLMAVSGDWITPWFTPDEPFWGKPPLAFWLQAVAIKAFGLAEFSVRLASLPAMIGTVWLCHALGRRMISRDAANWSMLILATMLLPAAAAGAVLTDPFLAFGVALSMTAFYMAIETPSWGWRYGFFAGLAIGLLAKGPLAVVLVAGAIVPWSIWQRPAGSPWRAHAPRLPWIGGIALLVLLVLPWYIAAEIKTPGFLRYFILGEHFHRFVDPGWSGDRYGYPKDRPYGSIWLEWMLASLPWGVIGVLAVLWRWRNAEARRQAMFVTIRDPRWSYLLIWAAATPMLFTFSRNVIWTYVLPALPPVALMLAAGMPGAPGRARRKGILACLMLVPLAFLVVGIAGVFDVERFKTAKGLVEQADALKAPGETLYFAGEVPFSARFYTRGTAEPIDIARLDEVLRAKDGRVLLAVSRNRMDRLLPHLPKDAARAYDSRRYVLFIVNAPGAAPAEAAPK